MSELINTCEHQNDIRRQLLVTVSAVALLGIGYAINPASASDGDRPQVWIELDGQFTRQEANTETFLPAFLLTSQFDGASRVGQLPSAIWDKAAKVSFQPPQSEWIVSLGIRYGKRTGRSAQYQLTAHPSAKYNYNAYQNVRSESSESHVLVDFQAGRDVGLGKIGTGGESILNFGVRYAQFSSRRDISIRSQPTNTVFTYHRFYASFEAVRKFSGVGPSLSWDASADLIGNPSAGRITFDWGLNGAVLFGRQRAQGHHQTSDFYLPYITNLSSRPVFHPHVPVYQRSAPIARSRAATVPNLGGFLGVSWRYPSAKVSLGYRADFFFGAIDGGIDTRKTYDRGFYGPFAAVSIGLGG